jgi:hypothetical protein
VTVVIAEDIGEGLTGYLLRKRPLFRLKAGLLREPNVALADVPVVTEDAHAPGGDGRALIPLRSVILVFISGVHDASIRAVNYALSLGGSETRAVYFELDPEEAHTIEQEWFDRRIGVPLDILEAPFRDLTGPMLDEVHRYTSTPDTLVTVVIPEFVPTKWRHYLLHNQNALFVKRLMLFEERVVLTSVPYVLGADRSPVERRPTGG